MQNKSEVSLGFSPCPNDTFIFYGLVHGAVENAHIAFQYPVLADVEQLNLWALEKKLDVTKLSFNALGHVLDEYCVLMAGSALGRGCGPLLVSRDDGVSSEVLVGKRIAIPGKYTTAALLLQMYLGPSCTLVEMRFDHIMDAIKNGEVEGGVIIHESRFTYEQLGLHCIQDLGQWWEDSTSMPIPLGCIAARRSLGRDKILAIERAIRQSIELAFDAPESCMQYIKQHSQELAPDVIQSHINLYVNNYSKNLGSDGILAVETFLERGRKVKAIPESNQMLTI